MLFPSSVLVIALASGQTVIGRCLVNSQLEYFLTHELDMSVMPGGIYTLGVRYISGTSLADVAFERYNFWDPTDQVITTFSNQQVLAMSVASEELIDKFLPTINQVALKPALYRPLLTFNNQFV